jgi:tRNA(fMet)-specific endonuclease VapC
MELVKEFERLERYDRVEILIRALDLVEVIAFDREISVIAGRIYGQLERIGQTIGRADPMIAATAIQHNLVLATGNIQHFERIHMPGLLLQNWYGQ